MDPLVFAIFGASGDLTRRKLIPAVFELFKGGHLNDNFALLGVSRSKLTDEEFRSKAFLDSGHLELKDEDAAVVEAFAKKLFYQPIDTADVNEYAKVKDRLEKLDSQFQAAGNFIFYLSTPPSLYETVPEYLAAHQLHQSESGYRRLVIEKPFGYDRESARQLNLKLRQRFEESQIYRIDHYLGKETVQNLLVTRFANGVFEPLWNRNYIHHVEITSAESIGVGSRGGYYEKSGALRDMLQNHLMQIVAHVAMEPPIGPDAESVRSEKIKLFKSLRPFEEQDVINNACLLYTSPSPRDQRGARMPSSA